jgi:NADH-quinone oxidoreductase subunit I
MHHEEVFTNRNVSESSAYYYVDIETYPTTGWDKFKQVVKRTFNGELFVGLWVVMREMIKFDIHTLQYPLEKLPIGPRYRAVHKLLRLWESGYERCIGCGLCEKICISDCIRMDTRIDENSRKEVTEYSINLGRCIFCGYCAEVCPELAIVHGGRYENASEQRAHFVIKDDMLTPLDLLKAGEQAEYPGFGAIIPGSDASVKKTPLAY